MVCVKYIEPKDKWNPVDGLIWHKPLHSIMNGGVGARCDVTFELIDRGHPADAFRGSFRLRQDGNSDTVDGIYFDERTAQQDNARRPAPADGQARQRLVGAAAEAKRPSCQQGVRGAMQSATALQDESQSPCHLRQSTSQQLRLQKTQLKPMGAASAPLEQSCRGGDGSPSFQGTKSPNDYARQSGAIPRITPKCDTMQDQIIPLLSACKLLSPVSRDSATTTSPLSQSDWGPLLKTVARDIRPRWQEIAAVLHFMPEECQEFNIRPSTSPPWWSAYRMLEAWRLKLPKCEPAQLRNILADAVRPFDDNLAQRISTQVLRLR